jgi:hypothetical protein
VLESGFAFALLLMGMTRSLEGTVMKVDVAKPAHVMVNVARQFQTFPLSDRAVVERETRFAGKRAATTRVDLADVTPGEFVRLQLNSRGEVTCVHGIARVERAKVRSVEGSTVVLEDGETLTIGSVLRFVDERGNPSATATVRPGDTVLLFHHLQTGNVYRFAAEPHTKRKATVRLRKEVHGS